VCVCVCVCMYVFLVLPSLPRPPLLPHQSEFVTQRRGPKKFFSLFFLLFQILGARHTQVCGIGYPTTFRFSPLAFTDAAEDIGCGVDACRWMSGVATVESEDCEKPSSYLGTSSLPPPPPPKNNFCPDDRFTAETAQAEKLPPPPALKVRETAGVSMSSSMLPLVRVNGSVCIYICIFVYICMYIQIDLCIYVCIFK
jgi:hypothetical protein